MYKRYSLESKGCKQREQFCGHLNISLRLRRYSRQRNFCSANFRILEVRCSDGYSTSNGIAAEKPSWDDLFRHHTVISEHNERNLRRNDQKFTNSPTRGTKHAQKLSVTVKWRMVQENNNAYHTLRQGLSRLMLGENELEKGENVFVYNEKNLFP